MPLKYSDFVKALKQSNNVRALESQIGYDDENILSNITNFRDEVSKDLSGKGLEFGVEKFNVIKQYLVGLTIHLSTIHLSRKRSISDEMVQNLEILKGDIQKTIKTLEKFAPPKPPFPQEEQEDEGTPPPKPPLPSDPKGKKRGSTERQGYDLDGKQSPEKKPKPCVTMSPTNRRRDYSPKNAPKEVAKTTSEEDLMKQHDGKDRGVHRLKKSKEKGGKSS